MLSARAGATQQASDAARRGRMRRSFDRLLTVIFSPGVVAAIGYLYSFSSSLDPRKAPNSTATAEEPAMVGDEGTSPLDRRLFLGGSAVTLLGASTGALAQQPQPPKTGEAATARLSPLIAD